MTASVVERVAALAGSRKALMGWIGIGVGLIGSLLLVARGQPELAWPLTRLLELWAVIGLVGVLVSRPTFVELVRSAPRTARLLLVVVVVGFGWAQYGIWSNDTTYPFVDWAMYTVPVSEITSYDFQLLEDDEPVGPLPVSQAAPTRSPRAFVGSLSSRAVDAADGDEVARAELEQAIAVIIDRTGMRQHADAVRVQRCELTAPVHETAPPTCERLLTIELADAGGPG